MAPRSTVIHSHANEVRAARSEQNKGRATQKFRLRYLLLALVCGWALFHYWTVQRPAVEELTAKHQQLQKQMASLTEKQAELSKRVQQLNDPAYIAQYASERFNLILPGQIPFDFSH